MVAAASASLPAAAADLLATWRDAVQSDAQFASARAQRSAVDERIPQARAGLLPTLSASANTTYNNQDVHYRTPTLFPEGKQRYNSNGWNVTLSQPLFRWQNWVAYKQSELQVAQAEAQLGQARQELALRTSQAYFDVLYAQDVLASIQAQKDATAQQLELAKRSFDVGTVTITDVHEAQSRYDLASAQEIASRADLDVKRDNLRQIIGHDPEVLKRLRGDVTLGAPSPDDVQQWVSSAETGALTVQAQIAAQEIASREVERARSGHLPTLDVVASYGQNGQGGSITGQGSDIKQSTIGLQLAVPLFAGGSVNSRMREAQALRQKADADLDFARRGAAFAARQAYLGVSAGRAQVKALEAALVSSQSSLDANKLGYEVGVRINIDVLNAQQQLYVTRRDLAKARYDTLMAQLKLKAAAGSLGEDDLAAVNALLE
ncbi:MAG: TolC family outer membrane protein [Rhodocyclaceae bacterium]|nr:TolC family outer membrane protein [Rhodocyclaceae bacterium]MBX3669149.1 TolC family outer membrane protein [Rhodocyclaceae bacterium]